MCRPVFCIAQESTEALKAMRKALLLKDSPATEDADVLAGIREELAKRALGRVTNDGWMTALDDDPDPFTW